MKNKNLSPTASITEFPLVALRSLYSPEKIRSLIIEKEKELHDMNEYRIRALENLVQEKVRPRSADYLALNQHMHTGICEQCAER